MVALNGVLSAAIQRAPTVATSRNAASMVDAQTTGIEAIFDKLYQSIEHHASSLELTVLFDHTVFVMYPRTVANYFYTYRGATVGAPLWASHSRYAVIDLKAIGTQYGSRDSNEGSKMPVSFPSVPWALFHMRPEDKTNYRDSPSIPLVEAKLAVSIVSAVEHLVLPDLLHESKFGNEQLLLIPIFVCRNHNQPFRPNALYDGEAYDFDVAQVVKEIQAIQIPGSTVRVVFKTHTMNDKDDVRNALRESIELQVKHTSVNIHGSSAIIGASTTTMQLQTTEVVNGKVLMDELDKLTSNFTNTLVRDMGESGKEIRAALFGGINRGVLERASPVRIFPIYVLSLRGMAPDLLFDDSSVFFSDTRGAAVLQSNYTSITLPLFGNDDSTLVTVDPSDPTRAIIDALLRGVGNIAPPHLKWSTTHNRTEVDYLWSVGCNTNGGFSGAREVSQMVLDNVRRASALTMVDNLFVTAKRVLRMLGKFEDNHVQSQKRTLSGATPNLLSVDLNGPSVALRATANVKLELKRARDILMRVSELLTSTNNDALFGVIAQLPRMAQQLNDHGKNLAETHMSL
jgi:hypothetical protein